jgi:hypothetical protein
MVFLQFFNNIHFHLWVTFVVSSLLRALKSGLDLIMKYGIFFSFHQKHGTYLYLKDYNLTGIDLYNRIMWNICVLGIMFLM